MSKNHTEKMTKILFSLLIALIICFISLLVHNINSKRHEGLHSKSSEGLTISLVPPHSPESPAYPGNLTMSEKINKLIIQSTDYANALNSNSPTTETAQNVVGVNLGGLSGYVYAAKIGIGTFDEDPQYKTYYLALDTGSTLTWLHCEDCQKDRNTCFPQVDPKFQRSSSTSYNPLMEDSHMCTYASAYSNANNLCHYKIKYVDGAKSSGQVAFENFTFESENKVRMVFGCGFNQRDFLVRPNEQEKAAGILGLGRGKLALHEQYFGDNESRFSYCFQDLLNRGGPPQYPTYLHFNKDIHDDLSTFQETPFQVVPRDPLYYVTLTNITINDTPVTMVPLDRVILDSGSSISFLSQRVYMSLEETLRSWLNSKGRAPKLSDANGQGGPTFCFIKNSTQGYEILPTLHFILEGGGDFEIKPEQGFVVWKDPKGEEHFCLMIEPHESLSIIGAFQQVNHKLIYDTHENKLLFKNEDCAKYP
ncbi:hypothetical protein RND81_09G016600 [Saponaria officinalis]|uniref:Peptidase A1 domain-containing protein n=1 Tax=Saponaria officinalis TaxID=3572 RepID=A0AAW1IHG8_SAPOF